MWYIILSLVALGLVAAVAGYFRNRKLQRQLERGEIDAIPDPQEIPEEAMKAFDCLVELGYTKQLVK